MTMKIKKGDTVKILAGKDRGKTGTILRVLPKEHKVVVDGANIMKKHVRASKKNPKGGIMSMPAPLPVSRVMPVCPRCNKATRIAITVDKQGKRHRTCRACHEIFTAKES